MKMPTDEQMRARFAELTEQIDSIEAQSEPLRTKRDKLVNDARDKEQVLNNQIAEIEATLFDLKNERGSIVRALNGKTSAPESSEDAAQAEPAQAAD